MLSHTAVERYRTEGYYFPLNILSRTEAADYRARLGEHEVCWSSSFFIKELEDVDTSILPPKFAGLATNFAISRHGKQSVAAGKAPTPHSSLCKADVPEP